MKKIFNIVLSAVVCLAGLAACTYDYPVGQMARNISVTPTSVQAPAAGQSFDATVTADGAWAVSAPEWIKVEPANGEGSQTVKVTVAANSEAARTGDVGFYSAVGAVSNTNIDLESTPLAAINVAQAAGSGESGGVETITIAELLEKGENSDSYQITGTITRITNTTYGNFDLTDETGTVYVYGLLNENLESKVCFKEKELAMGDVLTVTSNNLTLYNGTWEIVDAVYVSHEKSLIALDSDYVYIEKEGGNFDVVAEVKGTNVTVDYDADWITYNGSTKDGDIVTMSFTVAENAGVPRNEVMSISTSTASGETTAVEFKVEQDGSIPTVTIADALAAADDNATFYRVTGIITNVNNLAKGRFDITDATGTIYAYNTRVAKEADASTDLTTLGIAEGDVVTIIGYKTTFNTTAEIVGYVEDFYKVETVTVAEFLAKEESTDKWYKLTGAVTQPNEEETAAGNKFDIETWGNFVLEDETGRTYVYGVKTGLGGESKQFGTLGVKETDVITIVGNRAAYKGAPQVGNAWYVSHQEAAAAEITDATIAEVNAAPDDNKKLYRVQGYISDVNNLAKGRVYLTDATGTIYAFNLKSSENGSTDLEAAGIAKGDVVTAVGYKTTYTGGGSNTIELMGYVESFYKVEEVTVAQFLDKSVSTDNWYRLTGVVTKPNADESASGNKFDLDTWGNFVIVDETGRSYVYGVLTTFGGEKQKFGTLGVKEGDVITIVGNRAEYKSAPQVGNAWYVSHTEGVAPEEPEITIKDAKVSDVLAAADANDVFYRIKGYISKVNNLSKGRVYIKDYTGEIYAYNLKTEKDGSSTDLASAGIAEGDIVTVVGYKTTFTSGENSTIEIMGYVESFSKVEEVTVAEFLGKSVSTDNWYKITGTVSQPNETEAAAGNKFDIETWGNFVIVDESGRSYVYGVTTSFGGEKQKFGTLGVKEGDVITIVGNRAEYKSVAQVGNAWYVSHTAGTTPEEPEDPEVPEGETCLYHKVTAAPEDWTGTYLLVCDKDDINMAFSGFSGTIGAGSSVTINDGYITGNATIDAYQIVIEKASVTEGAYTIKFGDQFFVWTSGNSLKGTDEETANSNWTITYETDHAVIRNAAENARNLQWNKQSPRFACYGNDGQTIIQLYKQEPLLQ